LNKVALEAPLDVEQRAANRKAIEEHLSEERMRGYYRNLMLESHMKNQEK